MTKSKVWVLGSSNIDFTYKVEELPFKGQTIAASACEVGTGGKGANQAIAASHFGANVSFIGAVGNDPEVEIFLEALKKWKIDIGNVEILPGMKRRGEIAFLVPNDATDLKFMYKFDIISGTTVVFDIK